MFIATFPRILLQTAGSIALKKPAIFDEKIAEGFLPTEFWHPV